jgi:hypothetical protein
MKSSPSINILKHGSLLEFSAAEAEASRNPRKQGGLWTQHEECDDSSLRSRS